MADNNTVFNAKDFKFNTIEIVNSRGEAISIENILVQLQIFQDIYSSVMSGDIVITDGLDLLSNFQLDGSDYLRLSLDKPGLNASFERTFRIFKTIDRTPKGNSGQVYKLAFCSDENIVSNQNIISKAYKSAKIRDIVSDILVNELNVDPKRISGLESTSGDFDFIIPNYRPFEAIHWVTSRAYDQGKYCYFFFENKDGFNLKSLQSMTKQKIRKSLTHEIKSVDPDPSVNIDGIDNLRILNDFDLLTTITNGGFSSSMLTVDVFHQNFNYYSYNLANSNLMNSSLPISSSFKNTKKQSFFNAPGSFFRTYIQTNETLTEKNSHIDKWLMPRAMHMTMINHFKIKVVIPGDIELKAGDMVYVDFPVFEAATAAEKKLDKRKTGKYLVTAINHKFSGNKFESIVELASDSLSAASSQSNPNMDRVAKKGR